MKDGEIFLFFMTENLVLNREFLSELKHPYCETKKRLRVLDITP